MKRIVRMGIVLLLLLAPIMSSMAAGATGRSEVPVDAGTFDAEAVGRRLQGLSGLQSQSYVLMDQNSGAVLCAKDENRRVAPASITKIMTLLLVMEAMEQGRLTRETMVSVSEHAASMGGSQVYLEPGEQLCVDDLLKCVCIASANDASVALAEAVGGSEEAFVAEMNAQAAELSMSDTHFVNCYGLDTEGHYSSALDVAKMSRELMRRFPEISEYTTTWMDSIVHKTARGEQEFGLSNTNRLIRTYSGITGLKTGSTGRALYCLSATASRDHVNLVAVVLGAPSTKERFLEAAALLDYGFANFYAYVDKPMKLEAAVKGSLVRSIPVETAHGDGILLPKSVKAEEIERKITLGTINAPVKAGEVVGTVEYWLQGEPIGERPLLAGTGCERARFSDYLRWLLRLAL